MDKLIKYGEFECSKWNPIINENDPLFLIWLDAITPHLEGYELWIYGGVLENWLAMDIDGSIIGPLDSTKINRILRNIVKISFEFGIFPDIKYSFDGKLFSWSHWENTGERTYCKSAYYAPYMQYGSEFISWAIMENDLFVAERSFPMNLTVKKNHRYRDPIRFA